MRRCVEGLPHEPLVRRDQWNASHVCTEAADVSGETGAKSVTLAAWALPTDGTMHNRIKLKSARGEKLCKNTTTPQKYHTRGGHENSSGGERGHVIDSNHR